MIDKPNGLPWEPEAEKETHKGWRIIKTTAHYGDGVAASYMGEKDAKAVCHAVNTLYMSQIKGDSLTSTPENNEDEKASEEEKQRIFDFIKNDIMPLVAQQSGDDSERYRLAKMAYFVLRNRTVENWGPRELTMDVAMRLP